MSFQCWVAASISASVKIWPLDLSSWLCPVMNLSWKRTGDACWTSETVPFFGTPLREKGMLSHIRHPTTLHAKTPSCCWHISLTYMCICIYIYMRVCAHVNKQIYIYIITTFIVIIMKMITVLIVFIVVINIYDYSCHCHYYWCLLCLFLLLWFLLLLLVQN